MKTDWFAIGQNLLLLLVGVVTAWNAWRSRKNEATLNKVHVLVNHAMELQKKSLAEVTSAKALITHNPLDIEAAGKAMAEYQDQVRKQSSIDKI